MARLIWFSDLHFKSEGLEFGHDPRVRLDAVIDYVASHHSDAEAPDIGVITFDDDILRVQFEPFCDARTGFVSP